MLWLLPQGLSLLPAVLMGTGAKGTQTEPGFVRALGVSSAGHVKAAKLLELLYHPRGHRLSLICALPCSFPKTLSLQHLFLFRLTSQIPLPFSAQLSSVLCAQSRYSSGLVNRDLPRGVHFGALLQLLESVAHGRCSVPEGMNEQKHFG